MGHSAQVLIQHATMNKFQKKTLYVLGPFSSLWKGLEDIKNAPDDTVPVLVGDHIKLIEQAVLLLGQVSNSILYSRRLQILKTLIKNPKNAKTILKEIADLLKKGDENLFGKEFRSMLLKQNFPKNQLCRFFLTEVVALFLLLESPFGQALHRTTSNRMRKGHFTTVKTQTIKTDITHNMMG